MQHSKNIEELTDAQVEAEIKRLEAKEQELLIGNQRLNNQVNDLRELMKLVDGKYENDARQLINRNKDLENDITSLQLALKASEKHGSHLDKVGGFFSGKKDDNQ